MTDTAALAATVGVLGAFWANTITLGAAIVTGILGLATLVGIMYGAKWKSRWDQAQATLELYAKNAAGHEDRADLATLAMKELAEKTALEKEELLRQLADCREEIGRLRGRPDVAMLQDLAVNHETRAQERHDAAEARAQERHEAAMAADQAIAKVLAQLCERFDPPR